MRRDCTAGKLSECDEASDDVTRVAFADLELHSCSRSCPCRLRNGWSPYTMVLEFRVSKAVFRITMSCLKQNLAQTFQKNLRLHWSIFDTENTMDAHHTFKEIYHEFR